MHKFRDGKDRDWQVSLHVANVKKIRELLAFDIVASDVAKTLDRLASDPVLLVDTLFVICSDEAKKANVSDEDFGAAMYGDALDRATTALLDELVSFFRDARQREMATKLLDKSRQVTTLLIERVQKEVEAADPAKIASSILSTSASSLPESQASSPGASLSPNST